MPPWLLVGDSMRDATGVPGDAILVDDGTIAAVGTAGTLRRDGLAERRLRGVIVPGLRDAHLHPVGYAAALSRPSLRRAGDFSGIADILSVAAGAQPPGTALIALRLDDESLAEGRLPDRHFLDGVLPGRSVLAVRYCGHIAVASTAALEAAGITPDTPDPEGGTLDRDHHGLTGVLRETAVALVTRALRGPAPPLSSNQVAAAVSGLGAVGLTGLGAIVSLDEGLWGGTAGELDTLLAAAPDIPLGLRVLVIAETPADLEAAACRLEAAGPNVSFLGLKAFADGSLGGHTAALRRPYADLLGTRGTHRLDPAWADQMIRAAADLGGMAAIHAIGDAAVARVLDAMERAVDAGVDPARLRVEHASVVGPEDVARFARLGVTACVQPAFLASEAAWLETRLGPRRLAHAYPFRSLAEAGVPLAGGSDCPVEPPHPLWGMAAARDRCGITREQALTAGEALALFTTGAARAIGEDARIVPGAPATVTVLDRDPVESSPDELRRAAVVATFVAGKEVVAPAGSAVWDE